MTLDYRPRHQVVDRRLDARLLISSCLRTSSVDCHRVRGCAHRGRPPLPLVHASFGQRRRQTCRSVARTRTLLVSGASSPAPITASADVQVALWPACLH